MATLEEQKALIVAIIGPSFAGIFLYQIFFGVAFSMAWRYFDFAEHDPLILKLLVGWTLIFGCMQSSVLFHFMWHACVEAWGDFEKAITTPLSGKLVNVTTLFIIVPSQIFFARVAYRTLSGTRLFNLEGKHFFAVPIIAGILIVTASGLATCINELFLGLTYMSAPRFPNMYLWSIVAVEILTSSVLVARIKRLQTGTTEEAKNFLSRFIFMSLRTSSFTTSVALTNRLLAIGGQGLLGQFLGHWLSSVMMVSLYHTLNSRRELILKGTVLTDSEHHQQGKATQTQVRVETIVLRQVDQLERGDEIHSEETGVWDEKHNSMMDQGRRV